MTLREVIKNNREFIDECIQRVAPDAAQNDGERRMWILNDEGLYRWALREGWPG